MFQPGVSRIRSRSANYSVALFDLKAHCRGCLHKTLLNVVLSHRQVRLKHSEFIGLFNFIVSTLTCPSVNGCLRAGRPEFLSKAKDCPLCFHVLSSAVPSVKFTSHIHPVPKLITRGVCLHLHPHAPMVWC
jgi:hypothetical protein